MRSDLKAEAKRAPLVGEIGRGLRENATTRSSRATLSSTTLRSTKNQSPGSSGSPTRSALSTRIFIIATLSDCCHLWSQL
jgi:hypothetical protein